MEKVTFHPQSPTPDSGYTTDEDGRTSAPWATQRQSLDRESLKSTENVAFSSLATEIRDNNKTLLISKNTTDICLKRGWPVHENRKQFMSPRMTERLASLRTDIEELLTRAFKHQPKTLQKVLDDDLPLFNHLWFPDVDDSQYDDLLTVSLYCTWLFVWDDLTDSSDTSTSTSTSFSLPDDDSDNEDGLLALATDFERACAWREKTIDLARDWIIGHGNNDDDVPLPDADIKGSALLFYEFGKRIRQNQNLSKAQRERIVLETVRFIKGSETEQAQRLAGYLPRTVEEYIGVRLCSGAVWPCFLLLEIFSHTPIPDWIFYSPEMRTIWKDGNFLIVVLNDILSFKKELATNSLINIIPVLYFSTGLAWDEVMPAIETSVEAAAERIDKATEKLTEMTRDNPELQEAVARFVDGVKVNVTGSIGYSMATKRYSSLSKSLNGNGDLVIQL
ncbi:isoprenoid synthase domain-containing protein [Sordaria brevicollis]|uniref:Terpene synthase n=1 Tax=Sordaria brevicollis TaxID=83679 RepID=A0AAE0PF63_SORBR|nr:isoprenoid synthase domain-containing protein [Sordaria brevicollis]